MYQIVVVGQRGTGKSALIHHVCGILDGDMYDVPTDDCSKLTLEVDGRKVYVDLFEINDDDEYPIVSDRTIAHSQGCMVVFSITSAESLTVGKEFHERIRRLRVMEEVPTILVGTHSENESERQVSKEDAMDLADSWNCPYVEVCKEDGDRIDECFRDIIRVIDLGSSDNADTSKNGPPSRNRRSCFIM